MQDELAASRIWSRDAFLNTNPEISGLKTVSDSWGVS